jgi:hypothetical protein
MMFPNIMICRLPLNNGMAEIRDKSQEKFNVEPNGTESTASSTPISASIFLSNSIFTAISYYMNDRNGWQDNH